MSEQELTLTGWAQIAAFVESKDGWWDTHMNGGGIKLHLTNGWTVSIVRHDFSYGGPSGYFEIGLFKDGHMVHNSEWGDQVKGWLDEQEVIAAVLEIANWASDYEPDQRLSWPDLEGRDWDDGGLDDDDEED